MLEALLTIILSETDGWCIENDKNKTPSEEKREFMLNKIKALSEVENVSSDGKKMCSVEEIINETDDEIQEASEINDHIKKSL